MRSSELSQKISSTENHPWQDLALSDSGRIAIEDLLGLASEPDLQESLTTQLVQLLTQFPQLQRGLAPLLRFLENTRNPTSFLVFLDRDRDAMPTLLQILSIESEAVEWLVSDPDSFDWLRMSAGQSVDATHLKDILLGEIQNIEEEGQILASMQRFRRRETLRVICAFCLQDMPPSTVSQQLSWIADAGITASLVVANAERKTDRRSKANKVGSASELSDLLCILGLGALGGQELELDGPLELVVLTDTELLPDESRESYVMDELQRVIQRTFAILSHPEGLHYSVAFPCHPEEKSTGEVHLHDFRRWIQTIENQGRTWQRLTLLKARYLAGSPRLAARFLEEIPSLVYRRYLTRADIAGIGALKRKIDREGKAMESTLPDQPVWSFELLLRWKREIEFLTQFLQLINGGELPQIRIANTVQSLDALAQSNCLTDQERAILVAAYNRFSQTIFAIQLRNPLSKSKQEKVADAESKIALTQQLAYLGNNAAEQLDADLAESWNRVKQIRNHLRGEVFADENQASEETDLILDPNPKPEWIDALLAKHGFKRSNAAYRFLMELSREEVSMLSTRRCRHFLASIATQLLSKISRTPDPDLTLENLAVSCRSLGGKGVLWELFSVHEPSMDLYIRLCGASPYLIGILTSNPGMIDELLDSLMLNRLPTEQQMGLMLHELCRGAEDIEPILHSFKNTRHLNVGVRDILGKESITDTHRALSDIADVCLHQTVDWQYGRLVKRFGVPTSNDGEVCRFGVIAIGKLGAREPNYHSDVNLLFLYDSNGTTKPIGSGRHHEPISTQYFFLQLAQKVVQAANRVWRSGRLYETKNWILSDNRNTTLAWKLDELRQFFLETDGLALQRQQLCNARCILGSPPFQRSVDQTILDVLRLRSWTEADDQQSLAARMQLESTASPFNLKRGVGGTVDVETIAQLLTLRNVSAKPELFASGTLDAIERLRLAGLVSPEDADALKEGYNFLRGVESGLRLMNTQARHDLPTSENERSRLAYVLNLRSGHELVEQCELHRQKLRQLYMKYLGA